MSKKTRSVFVKLKAKRTGKQKRAQRNRDMIKSARALSEIFGTKRIHNSFKEILNEESQGS